MIWVHFSRTCGRTGGRCWSRFGAYPEPPVGADFLNLLADAFDVLDARFESFKGAEKGFLGRSVQDDLRRMAEIVEASDVAVAVS